MRNLFIAAAAAALVAGTAGAQEMRSSTVSVTGEVPIVCNLVAPVENLDIGSIIGGGSGGLIAEGGQAALGSVNCNVPYSIEYTGNGLLERVPALTGCPTVPFNGGIQHRNVTVGLNDGPEEFSQAQNNPALQVNVFIPNTDPDIRPCGGVYEGEITVVLTPAGAGV